MTDQPRDEPTRYDRLGPIARALVDDHDELDLAEMLVKAQDELAALRQVSRGYCPACGRGDAAPTVADWEQQKQRANQLAAVLDEVLRHFTFPGHPGQPCLSSGWISTRTVEHWRTVLDGEQQPYPPIGLT